MDTMNLDQLHNCVSNDIDNLISTAKQSDISLYDLLNKLYERDINNSFDVVELLLNKECIFPETHGEYIGSKISLITNSHQNYKMILFMCYLDNVYEKCFDGTETSVGLNDIIAYTIPVVDNKYLVTQWDGNIKKELENDFIVLDKIRTLATSKFGFKTLELEPTSYGITYTQEFARNASYYLHESVDFVRRIGVFTNKVLIKKCLELFCQDAKTMKMNQSDDITINGNNGIRMNHFCHINKEFGDELAPDTLIGDINSTLKYKITEKVIADSMGNESSLFGKKKKILTLDNSMVDTLKFQNKSVIFNKYNGIAMISNFNHEYRLDYSITENIVRQYFGRKFEFKRINDGARLIFEV